MTEIRMLVVSQSWLKYLLNYDSSTGIFTWNNPLANCRKKGDVAGSMGTRGYILIELKSVSFKASRLAWLYVYGVMPPDYVDHRNLDTSDNRIVNLRLATPTESGQNRGLQKNNKSGYKGVYWYPPMGKWHAQITVDKERVHLGYHDTKEEAAHKYNEAAKHYFDEFAKLNEVR